MYAGVYSVYGGAYNSSDVVNGCLVVTAAAGLLRRLANRLLALPGLARSLDRNLHALEALRQVALLLQCRASRHNMLNPSVRHFVLTARNKSRLAGARTEIPLTSILIHIV